MITFEPTNMIIASTRETGEVVGISAVKKDMHYLYLQTENEQYCTVVLPESMVK